MAVRTAERRRSMRVAAAYQALVRDRRGKFVARGRTANISHNGVFVVVHARTRAIESQVVLELSVPSAGQGRRGDTRTVVHLCRVVRTENMGDLLGIGLEFVETH